MRVFLVVLWIFTSSVAVGQVRADRWGVEAPDLLQTDPRGGYAKGGMWYCAPAALATGLVWMERRGFGGLLEASEEPLEAQFGLVRALASARYLDTDLTRGTGAGLVLEGLSRYLRDRGYGGHSLLYQGWRLHPRHHSAGESRPSLGWIKRGVGDAESVVWLNLGWYAHDPREDTWRRLGGHWVTVVGYGVDAAGRADPEVLLLQDPAPRAGDAPAVEHVRFVLLRGGTLTGSREGLPRSAAGYYVTSEGMHVRAGATAAILDGAVWLRLRR